MDEASRTPQSSGRTSYWFEDSDPAIALLHALRTFREADQEMRRRVSGDMDMNATDLAALRFLIAREREDDPASPGHLAEHLRISGPSTSKLLDRLTASGHLERTPHPHDGRARVVIAKERAHEEVRERLAGIHTRMMEVARDTPARDRDAVRDFLERMAHALAEDGTAEPTADEAPRRSAPRDRSAPAAGEREAPGR